MKKLKVYLQYPWGFPDSPYYKYLIDSPPKKVDFLNTERERGAKTDKKLIHRLNSLKGHVRKIIGFFRLPLPNIHITRSGKSFDLIHCAHCLSLNNKPWVVDLESSWQLWVSGEKTKINEKVVRRILKRSFCKKIICWTETTKKDFLKIFPDLKKKTEVVYPAVPYKSFIKKRTKKITLLFVGRYFYAKGGHHTLLVMNALTKKFPNIQGIIVSNVPTETKEKYKTNKKIKFFDLMPQKELFRKIYPASDIFLYPGYSDSFGFAMLEAMSFGIPVITVDGSARREIIKQGKTGFIVPADKKRDWEKDFLKIKNEEEIIKNLISKTELLINKNALRKKMSQNCLKAVKSGKFSIEKRNKKLAKIYEESLE